MITEERVRSRHRLQEAEGYLMLATSIASKFGLRADLRRRTVVKALRMARDCPVDLQHAWKRLLIMGQSLRVLRKYRAASVYLLEAARLEPTDPDIWLALGWALRRCGRLDQATTAVSRGLYFTPDHAGLHFNLACYLALLGQTPEAITELLWALDIEPDLRRRVDCEPDFDRIRMEPAFQAITQISV